MRHGVQIAPGRTVKDGCEPNFLPPGSARDLAALADEQAFRLFGGFVQATTASCGSGQFRATTNVTWPKAKKGQSSRWIDVNGIVLATPQVLALLPSRLRVCETQGADRKFSGSSSRTADAATLAV